MIQSIAVGWIARDAEQFPAGDQLTMAGAHDRTTVGSEVWLCSPRLGCRRRIRRSRSAGANGPYWTCSFTRSPAGGGAIDR